MDISLWIQFFVLTICLIIVTAQDFYEILGVKRDATEKEIKRAFRQLALKFHPDKNKDPKAEQTFRTMVEAYETLSNADKRREYDAHGHQSYQSSNQEGFSGFHFNMHDFFKQFDEASAKFHYAQHHAHHEAHQRAHQQAHQRTHDNAFGFDFSSLFDDDEGFQMDVNNPNEHHTESTKDMYGTAPNGDTIHVQTKSHTVIKHQHCQTVTRREGKKVSTVTECT